MLMFLDLADLLILFFVNTENKLKIFIYDAMEGSNIRPVRLVIENRRYFSLLNHSYATTLNKKQLRNSAKPCKL